MSDRYARHVLAFGEEGQKKIAATHVGIVGLGGIGAHIAQGLAYLGVRSFLLVDPDRVEETNLNRLIGAGAADIEALKVEVARKLIGYINPEAIVDTIAENIRTRQVLEALTTCPVIFGCVDHDGPRLVMMELTAAHEAVLIDSATEIFPESGGLWDFGGRVVVGRPGDFCLDCAGQIDLVTAKQELDVPAGQKVRRAHGYGLGAADPDPSVVSLNGVVANLAITEFMVMMVGIRAPHRRLTYYGLRGVVNVRNDPRRDDCYTCGYLAGLRDRANILRYALPDEGTASMQSAARILR